jgi:hypothetical protein
MTDYEAAVASIEKEVATDEGRKAYRRGDGLKRTEALKAQLQSLVTRLQQVH